MRRSVSLACSVITGAALIVIPAAQAQAVEHQVRFWGNIELSDDEGWLSRETRVVTFDKTMTIGDNKPQDEITVSECVGGEVRLDLHIKVSEQGGTQVASVRGLLYEGASCDNSDLDGQREFSLTTTDGAGPISMDSTVFGVDNEDEGYAMDRALVEIHMESLRTA